MHLLGRSTTFMQPMPGQPVSTGLWDQVMTWGAKIKEGAESVFDEQTLGQIVENFRGRKNLIGMDYEHQTANAPVNGAPAPQLALYNALAVIRGGKVIDFASRDPLLTPPNPAGKADGLYAYRSEVTPLGQDLLPNYRYISPMFDTEGANEQGEPIGYDLLNISAVSVPFQDGCEIQFDRLGKRPVKLSKGKKMDELKKFLGLADDVSMDDFFSACQKRFKKYDDDAAAMGKKYDDAMAKLAKFADDGDGDDDDKKKMDDVGMDDAAYDDAPVMADDDGDASAMQKMAKALGFSGKTSPRKMFAAMQAKTVPATEFAKLRQDLEALRSERAAEKQAEQEKTFAALADRAIGAGYDKGKRDSLIAFARADMKAAEEFVASLPKVTAMSRVTKNGNPLGKEVKAPEDFTASDDDISNDQASAEAHKYARENKVEFAQALAWVAQNKPQLYRRSTR